MSEEKEAKSRFWGWGPMVLVLLGALLGVGLIGRYFERFEQERQAWVQTQEDLRACRADLRGERQDRAAPPECPACPGGERLLEEHVTAARDAGPPFAILRRTAADAGPRVPPNGWCGEARRWCAQWGEDSPTCRDARMRCRRWRLSQQDAGSL